LARSTVQGAACAMTARVRSGGCRRHPAGGVRSTATGRDERRQPDRSPP
jgi:hypothetical protein